MCQNESGQDHLSPVNQANKLDVHGKMTLFLLEALTCHTDTAAAKRTAVAAVAEMLSAPVSSHLMYSETSASKVHTRNHVAIYSPKINKKNHTCQRYIRSGTAA